MSEGEGTVVDTVAEDTAEGNVTLLPSLISLWESYHVAFHEFYGRYQAQMGVCREVRSCTSGIHRLNGNHPQTGRHPSED